MRHKNEVLDTGYKIQDTGKKMPASCIVNRASRNRASYVVEYMALVVVIVLALLAMQFYLKRSMFGRLKNSADAFGQGKQYEPGVTVVTEN